MRAPVHPTAAAHNAPVDVARIRGVSRLWQALHRRWRSGRVCIVAPEGRLRSGARRGSAVVVCGPGFDQRVPNAATQSRLGWCRGFEAQGIAFRLVASHRLAAELDALDDPIVWISCADHATLDAGGLSALRRHRHAVLVDPAFPDSARWLNQRGLPALAMSAPAVARVLSTRPRFVFTIATATGWSFFEHWQQSGAPLVSIPLAFDANMDSDSTTPPPIPAHDMVFVGGYWDYKGRQFAQYLQPHADRLSVYGWSHWPYGRYGGQLPAEQEAPLYRAARVCPVINEPHVSLMGIDINERVFKVLGSGGLALTDATRAYRDLFTPDELLVPASLNEFHALAAALMAGELDGAALRRSGKAAVLARHTYCHRAALFSAWMDGRAIATPRHAPATTAPGTE